MLVNCSENGLCSHRGGDLPHRRRAQAHDSAGESITATWTVTGHHHQQPPLWSVFTPTLPISSLLVGLLTGSHPPDPSQVALLQHPSEFNRKLHFSSSQHLLRCVLLSSSTLPTVSHSVLSDLTHLSLFFFLGGGLFLFYGHHLSCPHLPCQIKTFSLSVLGCSKNRSRDLNVQN